MTLDDVPHRLCWRAMCAFVQHLPADSALVREMHPEQAGWTPAVQMLATIIDVVRENTWATITAAGGKADKPKPIKRPWDSGSRHFGSAQDAIPISEFDEWWGGATTWHQEESISLKRG